MDQLVHLCNSFVIFLESSDLTVQEALLLISQVKVFLEALDIGAKLLVFIGQLGVEILLEVHITLHVGHFTIPEVELAALLGVILLHQGNSSVDVSCLTILLFEGHLEALDSLCQSMLVGIEGCSKLLGTLALLLSLGLLILELV